MSRYGAIKCLLLPSIFALSIALSLSVYGDNSLQINASYAIADGHEVIRYVLKNISIHTINFDDATLPWRTIWNTKVILTYVNSPEIIQRAGMIDDLPPPKRVSLKPNQTLIGDSRIEYYFKDHFKSRLKGEIILFWFYEAKSFDGKSLGNYGGWLLIPQLVEN